MDENPQPTESVKDTSSQEARPRVRDLYAWKSMSRPMWQYGREVFAVFGAIALLVSVILAFFQEWLAIMVTWAAFFLFWALTRVAPEEVDHKITTEGIISMNHAYLWSELGPFWFSERSGEHILHVAHRNVFGQLAILVSPENKDKIQDVLAGYLPFVEIPEKSAVEKMTEWFAKRFPIAPKPKPQTT